MPRRFFEVKSMKTISIDIETFSDVNLAKCGVYKYAESPAFEILLFGYAVDGGEVQVVDLTQGERIPDAILDALTDESVTKWAFNASFERVCLSRYLRDLGMSLDPFHDHHPLSRDCARFLNSAGWKCSMIWSAYMGLPLSLEGVGAVLRLDSQKMKEGKDLIRYFCVPCKETKSNGGRTRNLPQHDLDKWILFKSYNKRDVEVEMAIQERLKKYPVPEPIWDEYHLDQEINDRGIAIDRTLAENAIVIDARSRDSLMAVLKGKTGLENPAEENVFKQLRLNIWTSASIRWIPEQVYDKGNLPIDLDSLRGRMCYGGLDLSSTSDITALVLAFPPRTEEEKYILLPFFWLPEDTLELRCRRDHVLYDVWQKQGFIQTTEGNVIHYGFIEKFIERLGETYYIREIAYDRWNATQMVQNLEDMGFTMVPFGQGFKDMSPPSKELFKLLMEGNINHGGNPVLKWMAGNVVMRQDPAGNIKPDKEKSVEKIDGIVASIMALDRCVRNGTGSGSVYDERGVIAF